MWIMMYLNLFGDVETSSIMCSDGSTPKNFTDAAIVATALHGTALCGVYNDNRMGEWKWKKEKSF